MQARPNLSPNQNRKKAALNYIPQSQVQSKINYKLDLKNQIRKEQKHQDKLKKEVDELK